LNPPGVFKKRRGKRSLGEKFDSKFYPNNYKQDVIYKNYEDLLDNLYMENKGIDYQLRSYKNYNTSHQQNENQDYKYNNDINSINKNNINMDYNNENDPQNNNYMSNINNMNNIKNMNNMNNINDINNINNNNEENEENEENDQNDQNDQNYQNEQNEQIEQNEDDIVMKKSNNNQFTFKNNYNNNNNFIINDNQIPNKQILRGKPFKLKENKTKLKNNTNKNSKKNNNTNYNKNNYDNHEKNLLNRYDNNSNIPEEEFETQEINDYENNSNKNDNNNTNSMNKSEDPRLNLVMEKLGLESLINVFDSYHMSFNDVLFLTKDDLNELGFKIFQKNRLISFIEEYTSKAKNYTLEEIKEFFEENNIYNITNNQE